MGAEKRAREARRARRNAIKIKAPHPEEVLAWLARLPPPGGWVTKRV